MGVLQERGEKADFLLVMLFCGLVVPVGRQEVPCENSIVHALSMGSGLFSTHLLWREL